MTHTSGGRRTLKTPSHRSWQRPRAIYSRGSLAISSIHSYASLLLSPIDSIEAVLETIARTVLARMEGSTQGYSRSAPRGKYTSTELLKR